MSPNLLPIFGLLSGLLSAACYVPYIIDILKQKTKPERASWLIWTVVTTIGFFSNLAVGATDSLWLPGVQSVGIIIIFLLSLRYGYGGLLKRDIIILIAAGLTLFLWYFTQQPLLALYLIIVIDCMGGLLTIVKAYKYPESETISTWALSGIAGLFAILSVGQIHLALLAYPIYIFIVNSSVVIAIVWGKKKNTKEANRRLRQS